MMIGCATRKPLHLARALAVAIQKGKPRQHQLSGDKQNACAEYGFFYLAIIGSCAGNIYHIHHTVSDHAEAIASVMIATTTAKTFPGSAIPPRGGSVGHFASFQSDRDSVAALRVSVQFYFALKVKLTVAGLPSRVADSLRLGSVCFLPSG